MVYDWVLSEYTALLTRAEAEQNTDVHYVKLAKAVAALLNGAAAIPIASQEDITFFGYLNLNRGTFELESGAACNCNMFYGSGWGPDNDDPATYLEFSSARAP